MNQQANNASAADDGSRRGNAPDQATKRLAQQGQWQTPPLPVFARQQQQQAATAATAAPATATGGGGSNLPTTPDEYARMLQEAYKRGAEAGARVAQQPASKQPPSGAGLQRPTAAATAAVSGGMPAPAAAAGRYMSHSVGAQQGMVAAGAGGAAYPTIAARQQQQQQHINNNNNNHHHRTTTNNAYASSVIPTAVPSNTNTTMGAPPQPQPPTTAAALTIASHSQSMPDISSYQAALANNADDEEDKRKKRLARNRASARLRRLKKKNLVDSYEGEVGILETALSKLRSHQWGASAAAAAGSNNNNNNNRSAAADHEALIEALSMERGQQPLTPEKRRGLVQSIVNQQREQVGNLLECQLENWLLYECASSAANAGNNIMNATNNNSMTPEDQELNQITNELQSILQLTPQQLQQINPSSSATENNNAHEIQDLFTVDACLESIHSNQWLLDSGVDELAGHFTSILNQTQLSKFLLWADHNADQIGELDYVNALGGAVGSGPVFEFGVDEGLADGD